MSCHGCITLVLVPPCTSSFAPVDMIWELADHGLGKTVTGLCGVPTTGVVSCSVTPDNGWRCWWALWGMGEGGIADSEGRLLSGGHERSRELLERPHDCAPDSVCSS